MFKPNISASITGLLLLLPVATLQAAPTIPGLVAPGQVEKQFKPQPQLRGSEGVMDIPLRQQQVPADADQVRFRVNSIQLDGFVVFSEAELDDAIKPLLEREVTLADLYQLAAELTRRYRNAGYILSQVFVPAQQVKDGVARLQAVEGFIDQVSIQGIDNDERNLVSAFANKISQTRPLTAAALERYMLLINDLPGITARAVLKRSETTFGAADLLIQGAHQTYQGSFGLDNRGGRLLGPVRLQARVTANNLLGIFDRTQLQMVHAEEDELRYFNFTHQQQIGTEGGRLTLDASWVDDEPEEVAFIPLNLETETINVNLTYNHPVIRSRAQNLYLRGGLSFYDGETTLFDVKIIDEQLRSLNLGLAYDFTDRSGATNLLDIQLTQGIDGLGASDNDDPLLSVADGKVDFTKLTLYAARLQPLAQQWSLLTAFNSQFSNDTLLSSERFSYGGLPFGRGYDPSEKVADNGAALKLELRYQPQVERSYYGFYDVGKIWNEDELDSDDTSPTASAGFGADFVIDRRFTVNLELAKPISKDVIAEDDRDWRGYFGLTAYF